MRDGERGAFSLLGLCALGIVVFFSAAAYAAAMRHMASEARLIERTALRNAAEDGVRLALVRMEEDAALAARAEAASAAHVLLLSGASGGAAFQVYARKENGTVLLLSVSRGGEARARAAAVLRAQDGRYIVDHWEH